MSESYFPTSRALENLFVNNPQLERVEAYLNRFNPIRTMRMERMEIRHSAILAWLLDPAETHGLGDRFLKAFLAEAYRGNDGVDGPSALEIIQSDLRDAEVRLEWQKIDIFILSPRNGWAFIIENKFDSSQHSNQLQRYLDKVRAIYRGSRELRICGVLLTLREEVAKVPPFVEIRYEVICGFLPRFLEQEAHVMRPEIAVFIRQYIEIIEEAAGMSSERNEMVKLARELYRSHKKVLDFVIEHGAATELSLAVEELFGADPQLLEVTQIGRRAQGFCYGDLHRDGVSFLPQDWVRAMGGKSVHWTGCENWWLGFPVICWISLVAGKDGARGQLRLYAEVGPLTDHAVRAALIGAIEEKAKSGGIKRIRFLQGAAKESSRSSKFFKDNSAEIGDIHDPEGIREGMEQLLERFHAEFEAVAEALRMLDVRQPAAE